MLRKILKSVKSEKGFTLIELLVVIAIIGILAAVAVPRFNNANRSANIAKVQADLRSLGSAMEMFYAQQNNTYPAALADLAPNYIRAIPTPPAGAGAYTLGANGLVTCAYIDANGAARNYTSQGD